MIADLEHDLREALAEEAAELPSEVSAELLVRDYRPRGSQGMALLGLATVALIGAVALAVTVIGLGSDTPRAFAGWTPAPTAARSDQLRSARSLCRSLLTRTSHLTERRLSTPPTSAWRTVLTDTRGPYTLILYEAGSGRATSVCFAGTHHIGSLAGSLGVGLGTRPPAAVRPGRVKYDGSGSGVTPRSEGSRQFSHVVGQTGRGVTGVTIRLNNGMRVTASRAKGWFMAWWPGSHGIRATEVSTAAGTEDQ